MRRAARSRKPAEDMLGPVLRRSREQIIEEAFDDGGQQQAEGRRAADAAPVPDEGRAGLDDEGARGDGGRADERSAAGRAALAEDEAGSQQGLSSERVSEPEAPFELTSPTREEIVARQEAEARRQAEQRRRESSPSDFVLTESDSRADQAAARGQMELEPPKEERSVARGQDAPYQSDLFGSPVPGPRGRPGPARPDGARVRRDVQSEPGVPGATDTPAPAGEYFVRTIAGRAGTRSVPDIRIDSPLEAAQATRYLFRSAVERFDGLVTDKDGRPLAVIGGFKGELAQSAVYPSTLIAEAVRIPGAAQVWFSHNHPSGSARLSPDGQRYYNNVAVRAANEKAPAVSQEDRASGGDVGSAAAFTGADASVLPAMHRVNPDTVSTVTDRGTGEPRASAIRDFESMDSDTRFSRAPGAALMQTGGPTHQGVNAAARGFTAMFQNSWVRSPAQGRRTFGKWRIINTQYHKATLDPDFKRVYDAAQDYTSDVGYFSNRAAAEAPSILPRVESLVDLAKKGC